MNSLENFFLRRVLRFIKNDLPDFVWKSLISLLPIAFLLSIMELLGLLILIPIIELIINPAKIHSGFFNGFYTWVGSPTDGFFVFILLALVLVFFIIKNVLLSWASLQQSNISFGVATRLVDLQFQRYLFQSYQDHVQANTGVLLRKIVEIPYNFTTGILIPVVTILNELLVALIIVIAICFYNLNLFLSMIFMVAPFFLLYFRRYKKRLSKASAERDAGHTRMFAKARQSIDGFREIRVFDKFHFFIPQFQNSVARFSEAISQVYHLNAFSPRIIEVLAVFCVFGIFSAGLAFNYNLASLATFLAAFAIAAYRLIPSINKILLAYNNIRSTEFVFQHFDSQLKQATVRTSFAHGTIAPLNLNQKMEMRHVSFSFLSDQPLLRDLSLTINKGEIIGIIGKSGSGKSTLINILLGLLQPTGGSIFLDDTEINESLLKRWHKTISFVPQNPILIEGSVRENIAFGVPVAEIEESKLRAAVTNSGLAEFISSLPEGLDTRLSDKSLNVSGGQKQRIAIARALYHDGQILIFDEATSSLDRETELLMTESIRALGSSYTVIIVAHRLESLRYCDRIFKLKDGKLGEPLKYTDVI